MAAAHAAAGGGIHLVAAPWARGVHCGQHRQSCRDDGAGRLRVAASTGIVTVATRANLDCRRRRRGPQVRQERGRTTPRGGPCADVAAHQMVFTALARSERSGVQMIVSMEVGHRPVEAPDWAPLLPGVRPCASDELPAGYAHGYRFVIPAIDMPPYLAYLLARLKDAGGTFQQDAVTSLEMVSGSVPAVVNCTGMGARELARDATLRPVRGQLVIIANPGVEIGLVEAEDEEDLTELTFLIP